MIEPLVSIIIPLFNAEEYVSSAIRSALDQTWTNKEIIVINDGSTDNSLAIAMEFETKGVKILHQENKGAGAARNKGLQEAKGDFIQFLDADDLIGPTKIERQVALLLNQTDKICACSTINFEGNDDPFAKEIEHTWVSAGSPSPVDFLCKLYGGDIVGPNLGGMVGVHAWLCSRSVIDLAGYWNENLSIDDDGEYFCRVILASKGILYAESTACYYRQRSDSKNISADLSRNGYNSLLNSIRLKQEHLLSAGNNLTLINHIFASQYWKVGVSTYPQYKDISQSAIAQAKRLSDFKPVFHFGVFNGLISKFLGWKAARRLIYLRHRL